MFSKKPRCKKCESTQVYYRRSTDEKVCQKCGYIEKVINNETNNN